MSVSCLSPAKLNLYLQVGEKRSDGYHQLQSVFQLIAWYDELHFFPSSVLQLTVSQRQLQNEDNLVIKAAQLLQSYSNSEAGVAVHLVKNIAVGGGLGGGSSNAAVTLLALNRLWKLGLTEAELFQLAARLGSDVPFFLSRCNNLVRGRGEQLIPVSLATRWYVLCLTDCLCSTRYVFENHNQRKQQLTTAQEWIRLPPCNPAAPYKPEELTLFGNAFLPTVCDLYPKLRDIHSAIVDYGFCLTGTGSSFFAVTHSRHEADRLAHAVTKLGKLVRCKVAKGINRYNYCVDGV